MPRSLLTLTAAAAAALALAACGEDAGSGSGENASPRERAQQGALKFARCMRENGVDMPDPQVGDNGLVRIGPGPGQGGPSGPDSPQERRALEACGKHLEEGGEAPDDAAMAKHRDAFVAYARCMREEGVDVPDPSQDGMVLDARDPDAPDPDSPEFQRADTVCHKHLAAVDAAVEGEGAD